MKPKTPPNTNRQFSILKIELTSIISMSHELVKLAEIIEWKNLEERFGEFYCQDNGRMAISTRLMISLHYLKYLNNMSDVEVLAHWVENPYWQFFSGMKHFEHRLPINSSSMTKWRKRIAKSGAEELLKQTIEAGLKLKVITPQHFENINVDTTVQEKNVRFPTDARLYHRCLIKLVKAAKEQGIILRQTYTRNSKKLLILQQRYAHSRKISLSRQCTKKLKTLFGRVLRDIQRKLINSNDKLQQLIDISTKIYFQKKNDKNKIYSVHEPQTACISKGKAHKKYEFGSKVSITTTSKSNFILGALSFLGNPHDGKTLSPALEQIKSFGFEPKNIFVDFGYKGHGIKDSKVYLCKHKRGVSRNLWGKMKRRAAIEPVIGHLKSEYGLERNKLSKNLGDMLNVILSSAAFNLKKLLNWLKSHFCALIFWLISQLFLSPEDKPILNFMRT